MNKNKSGVLLFLSWLLYTASYLSRYSYSSNITLIEQKFNILHSEAGLVTTMFFFAYGIGQVVNGILCKHYNKRIVLALSMIVSSVINLAIFLGVPFTLYKYLWLVNGFSLSVLWSSLINVLTDNLDETYMKKLPLVMSTCVPLGTLITYGLSSLLSYLNVYELSFLIACVVSAVCAIIWFVNYNKYATTPSTVKQPTNTIEKPKLSTSVIATFIILGVFAVINNTVKDGLTTWVPSILKESFNLSDSLSIILTLVLPILGVLGATIVIKLNKKFPSLTTLSSLLFIVPIVCITAVLALLKTNLWIIIIFAFGLIMLSMHGINNIITSIAPLTFKDKVNSGKLAGVLNGCCYLGSTISSYGLGVVADLYDWNGVFILLLCLCVIPVIVLIINVIIKLFTKNKVRT